LSFLTIVQSGSDGKAGDLASYGPAHREGFEDAVSRSSLSIPFRDPTGLAHFPVDSAAIERARIILTVYDPVDHFRSTVAIPKIRLSDWHPSG